MAYEKRYNYSLKAYDKPFFKEGFRAFCDFGAEGLLRILFFAADMGLVRELRY